MFLVISAVLRKYKIRYTKLVDEVTENVIDDGLENGRSIAIAKTKWHDEVLKKAQRCSKFCLALISMTYAKHMIIIVKTEFGENGGIMNSLKSG